MFAPMVPFLGMEIYSEKSLAPRNLSWINLGTTPRRHHTRGSGFVLAGFFSWPCARKKYPSRKFIQPQLWYFKSSGGLSHGKIFSYTGNQRKHKKSVRFLGAEFVGDLQRDKQDHLGHWNFIQRCLPPWSQNWFWIFFVYMYAWGLCPFLGMEIYSEKSLAPRNLSGINLGTTPRRHHTRGYVRSVNICPLQSTMHQHVQKGA